MVQPFIRANSRPSFLTTAPSDVHDHVIEDSQFEELWSYYRQWVIQRAGLLMGYASPDLDDVVQEVSIALHQAIRAGTMRAACPAIRAWLSVVTARLARRTYRARLRHVGSAGNVDLEEREAPDQDGLDDTVDRARLVRRLLKLGPSVMSSQTWRVTMASLSGDSHERIAADTGCTPGYVRVQLHRGLMAIRLAAEKLGKSAA